MRKRDRCLIFSSSEEQPSSCNRVKQAILSGRLLNMNGRTFASLLLRLTALLATQRISAYAQYVQCPTVTLDPVIQKGKRFFHSVTGEYFPIKGIAYYPRPNDGDLSISNSVDFFTDEYRDLWAADVEYFRRLGVNTIRIYAVDPSRNHDNFMCALQEAGIYVIVGLLADCEDCGIGPNEAPSCYPTPLKQRGQWIINEFSKYSNLLLISAGNEVTLYARDRQPEINAACQKKFLRDMRSYVDTCGANPLSILPRKVPIGMVNWDSQREAQAMYFNCRTDPSDDLENSAWYGLNSYQHCDPSDVTVEQLSGWIKLQQDFESLNLPVPVVIAEYGCREPFPTIGEFEAQRTWLQVDALYSAAYTEQFAGGVVFEYSAEKLIVDQLGTNPWPYYEFMKLQYGVGYYSPVDCNHTTIPCEYNPFPEFDLLRAKLESVDTSFAPNIDEYLPTGEIPQCPTGYPPLSDFVWPVDDEPDLPCYLVPTSPPTLPPTTSPRPSSQPSKLPTRTPISIPTSPPTSLPTRAPTRAPTPSPLARPTSSQSMIPTREGVPTVTPTSKPTATPTFEPTVTPTSKPTTYLSTIDGPAAFNQSPRPEPMPVAMPSDAPTPASGSTRLQRTSMAILLVTGLLLIFIVHNVI